MGGTLRSAICCLIELMVAARTFLSAMAGAATVVDDVVVFEIVPCPCTFAPVPEAVDSASGPITFPAFAAASASSSSAATAAALATSSEVMVIVVTVVVVVVTEGFFSGGVVPTDAIKDPNEMAHHEEGAFTGSDIASPPSPPDDDPSESCVDPFPVSIGEPLSLLESLVEEDDVVSGASCFLLASR